jgi:hypothetical protein
MTVIANNGASVQMILPNFMRARGMAVHQMVFFGSMVVGSLLWGKIATCRSVQTALILSALSLVPLTVLAASIRLPAARRVPRLTRHCGCVFCTTRHQIICRGEESLVTAYISCRYETKTPNARAAGP